MKQWITLAAALSLAACSGTNGAEATAETAAYGIERFFSLPGYFGPDAVTG